MRRMLPLPIPDTPRGSFYSCIHLKTRGKHNQSVCQNAALSIRHGASATHDGHTTVTRFENACSTVGFRSSMENPKQRIHLQNSAFSAGYDLQNSPADLAVQYVAALSGLVNRDQAHRRPLITNDI
ncbi:hypothetical protein [Bradyrhizobium sp. CSS354]|nr:hypothetical protein [Bradyrhizobium sp. CSS354]